MAKVSKSVFLPTNSNFFICLINLNAAAYDETCGRVCCSSRGTADKKVFSSQNFLLMDITSKHVSVNCVFIEFHNALWSTPRNPQLPEPLFSSLFRFFIIILAFQKYFESINDISMQSTHNHLI